MPPSTSLLMTMRLRHILFGYVSGYNCQRLLVRAWCASLEMNIEPIDQARGRGGIEQKLAVGKLRVSTLQMFGY